jgi:hypothetical protein
MKNAAHYNKTALENEAIRNAVYEYATEIILDALENDDAMDAAAKIREGIRAGWSAALLDCGMPEDEQAKLRFPI